MPGVKSGSGAIIASQSVVVSDVPAYSVVGGNPAKIIRHRFEENTIQALLKIAWWDWQAEKITEHLDAIVSHNLSDLRRAVDSEP